MAKNKVMGALGAVLEQAKSQADGGQQVPLPRASDSEPRAEATPRRFFPVKGNARVPAAICRPWKFADRADWEMGDLDGLSESIEQGGQLQAALVRNIPATSGSDIRYEVIAGRRRWESALRRGGELDVLIRDMTDQEAFAAMVAENEDRHDLSDFTRGVRFKRALQEGVFDDQATLSQRLRVSRATLSKLLRIADLDPAVVQAFSSPSVLTINLGYVLAQACEQGFTEHIVRDASKIESGEIEIRSIPGIWGGVTAKAETEKAPKTTATTSTSAAEKVSIMRDDDGYTLAQIRLGGRAPVLRFGKGLAPTAELVADLQKIFSRHRRKQRKD